MYIGGKIAIGKINFLDEDPKRNIVEIIVETGAELNLNFKRDQFIALKDMIDRFFKRGKQSGMDNFPENNVKLDLFVGIGRENFSVSLEPHGQDPYDEGHEALILCIRDSEDNKFGLSFDSGQVRTFHSVFDQFVKAQDVIDEMMEKKYSPASSF